MDNELKIEYLPVGSLKPYKKNAKKHPAEQIEHIANSIREFGFRQPLVIDKDNVLVIGHGRLLAAKKLGLDTVPCVRAGDLTEVQIKALRLADNKTNESEWDFDILGGELDDIFDIDMSEFGFELDFNEETEIENKPTDDNPYTSKTDIPQYEPNGENVSISDCLKMQKYETLIEHIKQSGVTDDEKFFLCMAAARHLCFSYKKIADYYASKASAEMQALMEESALVLIDYGDAIKNGYARLSKQIAAEVENNV